MGPTDVLLIGFSLGAGCLSLVYYWVHSARAARRLPPGPPRTFFVGNSLQILQSEPWRWCGAEMKEQYAVFHCIYTDRPRAVMAGEIMGVNHSTTLAPYGPYWRLHRRLWKHFLGQDAMRGYADVLKKQSCSLVSRLLEARDETTHSALRLTTVKVLLETAYGKEVESLDDEVNTSTRDIVESFTPGKYLVDVIPLLKYVPAWFPGAGWKRFGLRVRARLLSTVDEPYNAILGLMAAGRNVPHSLAQGILANPLGDDQTQKWVPGTVYAGGADTLHSAMNRFFVVMMLYPDVQRRAQQEIDTVVGSTRLPRPEDRDSLPYVKALIQELHRWNLVAPFGIPHFTTEDDEYRGFHIPKGSIVLPNYWTISQDSNMYPDPGRFMPERFMRSDNPDAFRPMDPEMYAFGVGPRACPGRHFAQAVLFDTITTVLATCDISRPLNERGAETEPHLKFSGLSLREMEPFDVHVEARSPNAVALLRPTHADEQI